MVQVNPSTSAVTVVANTTNSTTQVAAGQTSSYYALLSRAWAISPNLVQNEDYSSKYYANKSHEYADSILTDAGFIAVSENLEDINAVADDLTNIDAVVENEININAVADDLTNINSLAGSISNVNSVASDLTNIDSVAGDLTNINIVASAKTNIDTNATYISNINTVAGSITNVNAVAGDLTNVNAVANDLANIGTIVSNITDVNTCSTNISDINICAANIPVITDKVSKTGDTMTGNLTINKVAPTISCKAVGLNKTSTTAPSSDIVGALLQTQDENGNYVSTFYTSHNTSNNFATGINQERTINGVNKQSFFDINIAADGTDFVSASAGAKQSITNWAFPSSRYDNVTLGASGTQYTAPADGYVYLWGVQYDYNGGLFLTNNANGLQVISQPPNANSFEVRVWIPITKGDSYTVAYSALYIHGFRFIYANGEA